MMNYTKNFIYNGKKRFVENIVTIQKKLLYSGIRAYSNVGGKFIKGDRNNLIHSIKRQIKLFSMSTSTKTNDIISNDIISNDIIYDKKRMYYLFRKGFNKFISSFS